MDHSHQLGPIKFYDLSIEICSNKIWSKTSIHNSGVSYNVNMNFGTAIRVCNTRIVRCPYFRAISKMKTMCPFLQLITALKSKNRTEFENEHFLIKINHLFKMYSDKAHIVKSKFNSNKKP